MRERILGALLCLFMIGCSGGSSSSTKVESADDLPKWTYKPGLYEDVIIAAGIGTGLTERKAKSQAETDGRRQIAQTLQSQIKSMTTDFMEEATTITETATESAAQEYFEQITQSITKVTLNGAQVEEYWPPLGLKEGNKIKFYAKVVLKKNQLVDQFKEQVQEDAAANKIKGVKLSADDALSALDKAIAKWESDSDLGSDE